MSMNACVTCILAAQSNMFWKNTYEQQMILYHQTVVNHLNILIHYCAKCQCHPLSLYPRDPSVPAPVNMMLLPCLVALLSTLADASE